MIKVRERGWNKLYCSLSTCSLKFVLRVCYNIWFLQVNTNKNFINEGVIYLWFQLKKKIKKNWRRTVRKKQYWWRIDKLKMPMIEGSNNLVFKVLGSLEGSAIVIYDVMLNYARYVRIRIMREITEKQKQIIKL